MLVSGDLPRFALARTFPSPTLNPQIAKLGDLRIRLGIDGKDYWLDEFDNIRARFYPWGTMHQVNLQPDTALSFQVLATMVEDRGIAVEIEVCGPENPLDVRLDLVYGGLALKEPQVASPYFEAYPKDTQHNEIKLGQAGGKLSDPSIPAEVTVAARPVGHARLNETNELVIQYRFMAGESVRVFRILAFQLQAGESQEPSIELFDEYVRRTREYYETLLGSFEIHTPDKALNTAFYTAVVNLDYSFQPPAWLEGIHKWNSYIVNNYQISAAVCLGWLERARGVLLFFGDRPGGPGQSLNADGSPKRDLVNLQFEGGLPYFILQLFRYWRATGDKQLLDCIWQPTVENLKRMLKLRDPDNNLLLNWHRGANMFLYQADHLSLPGDAFSPTIMVAENLEQMAEMQDARGDSACAAAWRHRAEYMRSEAVRRFWSSEKSKFTAGVDPQGLVMQANYYTDFVFPQLYSTLPAELSWASLRTLDCTLWIGEHFMRVGNYQPPLFGNNNVMPVQMAEAAEAYFQAGRPDEGSHLLHGVALGATTDTDSPGSFPERMSDTGYGQPDYLFSNPAGAFVRAVVSGLFGLERTAVNRPLVWRPAIPDAWHSASLKVGDISVGISGLHGNRNYYVKLAKPQAIDFRAPLHSHRVYSVKDADGQNLAFTVMPHPSGDFLHVRLNPATHLEFQVFSHLAENPRMLSIPVSPAPKKRRALVLSGRREPMNLEREFNSDSIMTRNFWRHVPVKIDFSERLGVKGATHGFRVGPFSFQIRPQGRNIVVLEVGELHSYTQALELSDKPSAVVFHVGKAVRGVEFLVAAEVDVRLTGVQVGLIRLHYAGGPPATEVLTYGRNVDCFTKPFATDVVTRELDWLSHVSAFSITADEARILNSIEVCLFAADTSFGILAINRVRPE